MLRQVLATPGADVSATETIAAEWADQHGITRVWAEYQTLAATALRDRYDDLFTTRSGLSGEQADQVCGSPSYGALVAALANAEARGLDVHAALHHLVEARTLADADDVAAVLHGRVEHWARATRVRRQVAPDRIVGLFPKVDAPTDSDMARALDERQAFIERRTRELSEQALHDRQPWAAQLGTPPRDPVRRELWFRNVDTVTAYRERWNIASDDLLGRATPGSLEQEEQRFLTRNAADAALQLHRPDPRHIGWVPPATTHQLNRVGPEL